MGSIMLSFKVISVIAFLAFIKCNELQQAGHSSKISKPSTEITSSVIGNLEKRLKVVENILLNADISDSLKANIADALKEERSIEDDVQTNKEDIIDLRMTDGRHDFLISDGMAMTNYINNTIIPTLMLMLATPTTRTTAAMATFHCSLEATKHTMKTLYARDTTMMETVEATM